MTYCSETYLLNKLRKCGIGKKPKLTPEEKRARKLQAYRDYYQRKKQMLHLNPVGRPKTSTHPRAEYWRQYKLRKKAVSLTNQSAGVLPVDSSESRQ